MTMSDNQKMKDEVKWYRQRGKYPKQRICREYRGSGAEYVIGDWGWDRAHPDLPEKIERLLPRTP